MDRSKEILFEVSKDALLVANGGSPFSRTGVISVCASHLSDKRSDGEENTEVMDNFKDANGENVADDQLIQAILRRELNTYKGDQNRITSDFRGEDETTRDYGGRFVWELLQNADDAMKPKGSGGNFIGSKGLGFKAVLEVTDEPEVHSYPFHFRFSSRATQVLLKNEKLNDSPLPLTFRIPHAHEPEQRIKELLEEGYATVIRLPFRDAKREKRRLICWKSWIPFSCFSFTSCPAFASAPRRAKRSTG